MFGAKPKAGFRPYQPPEPQPRGAVTRRAVARRRSRARRLDSPLGCGYPGGLGLGFVAVPFPPFSHEDGTGDRFVGQVHQASKLVGASWRGQLSHRVGGEMRCY